MKDLQILGIDTSGKIASVAISDGEKILWEKSVYTKLTHSQVILPMVKDALTECELSFSDLDCVAVANGPGSYTGLRIGIGAVKGMCMGEKKLKCAGISTLMSLAYNCCEFDGKIIAVMKARPKIVYVAEYEMSEGKMKTICKDKICGEDEFFGQIDGNEKIILVGDHAKEIKEKFFSQNDNVKTASQANILQKASSLCLATEQHPEYIVSADELKVSYLQATKAEKDKAHR